MSADSARMVLRSRRGRRESGSDAAGLERDDLRHHELERRFRCRCAHRQGEVALGSRSQPDDGAAEDLLRRRESRHRDLSGHDHRSGHRRQADRARCRNRQAGVGSARGVSAGQLHDHDGAAHRQRQSDHRRQRRRNIRRADSSPPSTRRPEASRGGSIRSRAIRRSRSRIRR